MNTTWILIAGLAIGTFGIRLAGYALGARLPQEGPWARGLSALPGTLITALVALQLAGGGPAVWLAAGAALIAALVTRNLPLTMLVGILVVVAARAGGLG